mgnify:CR=1 FL=1
MVVWPGVFAGAFAVVLAIALWMVGFSLRPDYWWNLQNSFAILLNYTEIALLAIGIWGARENRRWVEGTAP